MDRNAGDREYVKAKGRRMESCTVVGRIVVGGGLWKQSSSTVREERKGERKRKMKQRELRVVLT